ncbi:MAG: DNA repair protein RecN [Micavibrio sp.]|nr:DNA repair protein RecN [Micavibrio sp.]|tara:strand:- start:4566 stop:6227 length:1662 start_codon:yes stop_codon:yes gene_type:complete
MLESLSIQNVVIIEKLNIEFKAGLCTLTGETGAGKSILLDSLGLAIGMRAESALVRKGADQANVSAMFNVRSDSPVYLKMEEAGLQVETGEAIVLRRSLSNDGRSKAFINDQPVSVRLLRDIGADLLEIHGQFDTQGLLNPSTHRAMLDEYAGIGDALVKPWQDWQEAELAYSAIKEEAEKSRSEEGYLRAALEDIDELSPQCGEEETLSTLRGRLMHREQVLEGLNAAYAYLQSEDDPIRRASGVLDRLGDKLGDEGNQILEALDRASCEMQEAVSAIQSLFADMEHEDHDLTSIDDRLHALRGQARKHDCTVDELPAKRDELAQKLNRIEHADDLLAEAGRAVEHTRKIYLERAKDMSQKRSAAAKRLDSLVMAELAPLKLERAKFYTQVEPQSEDAEWGMYGIDRVRFLVATNPGAEPGPLHKIASGGEMSRFMLALKVVMAEIGVAGTLIFDEVDAGIGGGTADAVGERLSRLAGDKQILVVTHSPQVAARANHHWIVHKGGDDIVTTNVLELSSRQERCEEIARMLSGASISQEARAAADKLLEASAA